MNSNEASSVKSEQAASVKPEEAASLKSKEAAASGNSKEAKNESSDSDDSSSSASSSNDDDDGKLAPKSSAQMKRKLQLAKVALDSLLIATEGMFEDCDCGDKLQEAHQRVVSVLRNM